MTKTLSELSLQPTSNTFEYSLVQDPPESCKLILIVLLLKSLLEKAVMCSFAYFPLMANYYFHQGRLDLLEPNESYSETSIMHEQTKNKLNKWTSWTKIE